MKTFEVDLLQKEWYTVEVKANTWEEAESIANELVFASGTPVDEDAYRATAVHHGLSPEADIDDVFEIAKETGFLEIEIGQVNEV